MFESAGDARVAIPLARIDRLEEIPPERVERVSGRDVVQYRGSIMPLCHLAHTLHGVPLEKARSRADGERWQVVVVPAGGDVIGLVVDRLFDIVEATVDLRGVGRRHGVLGTSVVAGRVVEILDLDAVVAGTLPRGASEPRREA